MCAVQEFHVLFIDDDKTATKNLIEALKRRNAPFCSHSVSSISDAMEFVKQTPPNVAVVDLSLDESIGPESGFLLINKLLTFNPSIRIIVLTGHNSEEFGIRALQQGAASFISKPVDIQHLFALLNDAITYSSLYKQYQILKNQAASSSLASSLVSNNPTMQGIIETVRYAQSNSQPVLILGETGVGKGVIANAIHNIITYQKKAPKPFIRFQPSFGSQDLIASELFGHKRGAFTGANEDRVGLLEAADCGTLFIDEVGELPRETQILLLTTLQDKTFRRLGESKERKSNFRLISATNIPLKQLQEGNKLRSDFYHRIAHITIEIPPLRKRIEDIEMLAEQFFQTIVNRDNIPIHGFTPQALAYLRSYNWPGNIRELQTKVEIGIHRAHFSKRVFIEPQDLCLGKPNEIESSKASSLREQIKLYEKELVVEAMRVCENNQTRAAEWLSVDRTSLRRILNR
jgi:DNA-binding NtrC family response regulator